MSTEHVTISIGTGNDAFVESPTGEIARILRELADRFEQDGLPGGAIYDLNGNFVGEVTIVEGDDDEAYDENGNLRAGDS